VFERRMRALRQAWPGVVAGEAEAVHRMRVASRRLREAIPLLEVAADGAEIDTKTGRKVARALRRVTRALGGVRELDVALGFLDEFSRAGSALRNAVGTVRQVIRWERDVRRRAMLPVLDRIDIEKIGRRIAQALVDSQVAASDSSWRKRLGRRIERRAGRVDAAVDAAGSLYAPERLHRVRIAAKKLRYALELARELAAVPTLGATRRLKRMQDLLGRMHDLEVLAGYTRLLDLQASTRGRLHARVGLLLDAINTELRLLHAGYLASRQDLIEVAALSQSVYGPALASRLAGGRKRRPPKAGTVGKHGRDDHALRRAPRHRG
jgi:CHAD domain-containing protein